MNAIKSLLLKTLSLGLIAGALACVDVRAASDFDQRPTPIKTPPPEYPYEMRKDNITGIVAVRVTIDEAGSVTECAVEKSSRAEFEQPALHALKNWKFKPALKQGNPVKVTLIVPVKFAVDE